MREPLNSRNLSPKIWLDTKPRIRNQRTFGETDIMRKQWNISAQRLLTLSAFGILAGFSAPGFYLTGSTNAAEQTKPGIIIASAKPAALKTATENKAEDSIALAESMRIHIEFLADPVISATDISPSVKNGRMILHGNVNNNTVADSAVALASRLTTSKVTSEIKIWPVSFNKNTKVPVETLQANTNKVVSAEFQTSYPRLSTSVSADGSIIVFGPVVTLEDKLEISKRLRKVQGCQRVVNKMIVQPMRMGGETVTMINKDGTKWIVGKDQTTAPASAIQLNPTPSPTNAKEITQTIVSTKPVDKVSPVIVPTQGTVQAPKATNTNGQRPQVLPESLVPVIPVAKPLPTPEKAVDVFAIPKLPQDWGSKKNEAVKPAETAAKKAPIVDNTKTVTKTVEAQPTSKTKEKVEEFPSFPNLNKKPEKADSIAKEPAKEPANKKETPLVKQATPVAPKKELSKAADKKEPSSPKVIVEKEFVKGKVDTVTKSAARIFMPAHDPVGSALVKTDMLGFPTVRLDAPAPEAKKPLFTDKIPTRYATNSDKDGEYNRPYLAARTRVKPVSSENMLTEKETSVASKPAAKEIKITEPKQNNSVTSQPLVKKESAQTSTPPNPSKVIAKPEAPASTVSNNKGKTVPATTASKKSESSTSPKIATGTISFDSEEGTQTTNSNQQTALNSLKKQVEQACGRKASSVQVVEKPDGSKVLLIDVAQGSKQEDLAKTLFSMPEIAENNVTIEFIIK